MHKEVFSPIYAEQYDLLYHDKNYEAECDLLESVFQRYGNRSIKSILDMGCGTGNHTIPLALRGYDVVGIDLSSAMIDRAEKKALKIFKNIKATRPEFLVDEIRSMNLKKSFDAILCMFSVLGYQLKNEDVLKSLCNIRRHLKKGGIFVCDLWYGPGVLMISPSEKIKIIESKKYKLIRSAHSKLDINKHIAEINYHLWFLKGQKLISETVELHQVRFFFPQEIAFFMNRAGLQLISLTSFPTLDQEPNNTTWNILCVAKSN